MRNVAIPGAVHQGDRDLEFLDKTHRGIEAVLDSEIEIEALDILESKSRQRIEIPIGPLPLVEMMQRIMAKTVRFEPTTRRL